MNHTITNKIRKVAGITSTVTLVVIEEQGGKDSELATINFILPPSFYSLVLFS